MRAALLDTEERVEAALRLAKATFGHLDLGGSSVRQELAEVDWARSTPSVEYAILVYSKDSTRFGALQADESRPPRHPWRTHR